MKLYEKMKYGENLSWCKPVEYKNEFKSVVHILNEGCTDSIYFYNNGNIARTVIGIVDKLYDESNEKYCEGSAENLIADFLGVAEDDLDDFYCGELGCAECPARDDCDNMDDYDEC